MQTVELVFGTKRELLKAVIDVAIAGDDQPVPVLQRDWARAELTAEVTEFLAIAGHAVRTVADRVAGLLAVVDEAASTDHEIAALRAPARRATCHDRRPDRDGHHRARTAENRFRHEDAVDTIWLLMDPVVFRRGTEQYGTG